ncbi:hypothetical protein [Pseudomonas sp. M30-35]|uniref:hypothetical protein n=1 Tax=Pseudomonas sp. M30-35 TaxID=1981174 RepID=UPI0015AA73DB|nr:hypothetical protein [Pseudomonas sp. M30-35]
MADQLKCRRCRWIGSHEELRQRPDPKERGVSDNVCPRCACKTFTPVEEQKHD